MSVAGQPHDNSDQGAYNFTNEKRTVGNHYNVVDQLVSRQEVSSLIEMQYTFPPNLACRATS